MKKNQYSIVTRDILVDALLRFCQNMKIVLNKFSRVKKIEFDKTGVENRTQQI